MSGSFPSPALVFSLVVAATTLLVFVTVLRPLWRDKPRVALILIAALTLGSAALYRVVGTPAALDAAAVERPDTIEEAVAQLEKNSDRFADHQGWVMLANAYARMGEATKARDAWEKAVSMTPDDADLRAATAEARARAHPQQRFDARAVEHLRHALQRNPKHQRARLFLGVSLRQQGKPGEAAEAWMPLLATTEGDARTTLRGEIDAARADAGLPPLPEDAAAPAKGALVVKVALDPDFAARVRLRGDATVFVIARAPGGPPMPVAVEKHPLSALPLTVTLDDTDGPMPTAKLSALQDVEVIARISDSGNAMRQDGDLESAPQRVRLPSTAPVVLTLGAP
ncbi:MAG TPA: tetratricopeptide repeat protein [Xanthomonadaceae bacterium]